MILIGLLLMLACAALAADAVVQNGHGLHVIAFNQGITHMSPGTVFVAGAVLGLIFAFGLLMMTGGMSRMRRRRIERRQAVEEVETENDALRDHNEQLAAELTASREAAYPPEPTTVSETTATGGRHRR
jgi:hypothetical protein